MTIKFHSEAKKEFFETSEYYEEQVVGLGDDFIDEVQKVLDVFEQQPSAGTKITKTERRFLVSRFRMELFILWKTRLLPYLLS